MKEYNERKERIEQKIELHNSRLWMKNVLNQCGIKGIKR